MKKNFALTSLIVMLILFLVGLIILFSSTSIGENAGGKAIRAHGGSMDTNSYNYIMNSTTENFRTGGMVIAFVGGLGVLISGYGFYKEI
ncbi:MAG: hypothetical protein K0R84_2042 [Clostridia bacterium]|jgi:hypothetical protein|nr:hypothetical protein [Clostridia bacterium]